MMRINITSVFVDDQHKALTFYTEVLGFVKKTEIPLGSAAWLTVVSPDAPLPSPGAAPATRTPSPQVESTPSEAPPFFAKHEMPLIAIQEAIVVLLFWPK